MRINARMAPVVILTVLAVMVGSTTAWATAYQMDTVAYVDAAGRVTVSGTATCNADGNVSVFVELDQWGRRGVDNGAFGENQVVFPCSTTPGAWSLTLESWGDQSFGPGQAIGEIWVHECTSGECEYQHSDALTVELWPAW